MRNRPHLGMLLPIVGLWGFIQTTVSALEVPPPAAFTNVNVLSMDTPGALLRQTVLVNNGRIQSIAPRQGSSVPPNAVLIDCPGCFLMPGLADMHVHIRSQDDLTLMVANGVTFVRNMDGTRTVLSLREQIRSGHILGPTITTTGPIMDGASEESLVREPATTPEIARAMVRRDHAAGYDSVKVYHFLRADVFYAIADEARKLGIQFSGHVPYSVPVEEAMRAGMASIEHLKGFNVVTVADDYTLGVGFRAKEKMELGMKLASGELGLEQAFDRRKMQHLATLAAQLNVWNTPTLQALTNVSLTRAETIERFKRPEMRFVSKTMMPEWMPDKAFRSRGFNDEQLSGFAFLLKVDYLQVDALNKAGAGILAGSDSSLPVVDDAGAVIAGVPFMLPGFGLLDELTLLHAAGLTNEEVLRCATRNAAEFLHERGEFGSVTAGSRADLLLLKADPRVDLAALRTPVGVMLRGAWFPQAHLRQELERLARRVAAQNLRQPSAALAEGGRPHPRRFSASSNSAMPHVN